MNADAIIKLLTIIVAALPGAITTTTQLIDLGKKFWLSTNGTAPTEADITAIEAAIDADVLLALAQLPIAQPGDPDYVKPV